MGRSVDYLNNAVCVNYFQWPRMWDVDDNGKDIETEEYEDASFVIEDIRETIISEYPEFSKCSRWDGREVHVILEGYGTEIALSEYCGLSSLSIRVDQSILEYCDTEEESEELNNSTEQWINDNWPNIGKYWNIYRKIGTFNNGEAVYEQTKKDIK